MSVGINVITSLTPLSYVIDYPETGANALNDLGMAVGASEEIPVEWVGSAVVALPLLNSGDLYNAATGINDQSQIVGYEAADGFNAPHAVLWQNGTASYIGNPSYFSQALAINDQGQVVGIAGALNTAGQAFIWQNGVMTFLPNLPGVTNANSGSYAGFAYDINQSSQVVGYALTATNSDHAVLWQNGTVTDLGTLAGGNFSEAFSINDLGEIVGFSRTSANAYTGFVWQNGSMTALAALSGYDQSSAADINDAGIIVGESMKTGSSQTIATIWENGTPTDLNMLLPSSYSGSSLTSAQAINNNSQILVSDAYGDTYVVTLDAGTAGLTAVSATQSFIAGTIKTAVPVLDSAANVQAGLDALQSMADVGLINGITFTDANPALTITAAQMERDSAALQDIQGYYSLTVTGTVTAFAVTATTADHVSALAVSDSAASVAANIANIEGVAEFADLTIHLTDSGTPTLTLSAEQTDGEALLAIAGPYQLILTQVGAGSAVADAAEAHVVGVEISDTDFDVGQNLDALQTLAVAGKLVSVVLQASSNVANSSNTPVLPLTVAQLAADGAAIAKIGGTFDIDITVPANSASITGIDGHANIVTFSGTAATFTVTAAQDGHSLIVGNGTASYQLDNIQGLQFSDHVLIAAQIPGTDTVTTGNVTELYSAVFAREPDLAGLSFYQNYLAAHAGTPLVQFAEWFLGSAEYSGNSAHTYAQTIAGDAQFITDSYQNLLHRTPSAAELAYYQTNVLQPTLAGLTAGTAAYAAAQTQAHAQMLVYFSASAEFLSDVQVTAQSPASAQHWLVLV